jgi:hypothetical protein
MLLLLSGARQSGIPAQGRRLGALQTIIWADARWNPLHATRLGAAPRRVDVSAIDCCEDFSGLRNRIVQPPEYLLAQGGLGSDVGAAMQYGGSTASLGGVIGTHG